MDHYVLSHYHRPYHYPARALSPLKGRRSISLLRFWNDLPWELDEPGSMFEFAFSVFNLQSTGENLGVGCRCKTIWIPR